MPYVLRFLTILSGALAVSGQLGAQQSITLNAAPPGGFISVTAQAQAPFGASAPCYWVVATFPIGQSAPSAPACTPNVVGTQVFVTWNGVTGAVSYDLLRTQSAVLPPAGISSNVAVATAIPGTSFTDTFGALNPYTIVTASSATAVFLLDNQNQSTPAVRLTVSNSTSSTSFLLSGNTGLADPGTNGYVVRTIGGSTVSRTFTAIGPIGVSNGDGQSGNTAIFCNNCVTASSGLTTFAVMVGQGVRASTAIAVDSTPTHALFATGANPAFRAIATSDLPPVSIAAGTTAMPTISVPGNGCSAAATTATATGALTTDRVAFSFSGDPTGLVGYGVGGSEVTVVTWASANQVNFKLCNASGSAVTPGAASVNWGITR